MDEYIEFYKKVGEYLPEEYLTYSIPNARVRERFIRNKLKRVNGKILDVGCGAGRLTSGFNVVGIDLSPAKLKIAVDRNKSGDYVAGDIENSLFMRENSFDFVLFSEVIEHLRSPEKALQNIYKLLKPGGKMLLTTPHRLRKKVEYLPVKLLSPFGIKKGTGKDRYVHRNFTKKEMEDLLYSAGFKIIEMGTLENELRGWGKIVLPFRRWPEFYWKVAIFYLNAVYDFLVNTHLMKLQKMIFKQGMRLFTVARKPE